MDYSIYGIIMLKFDKNERTYYQDDPIAIAPFAL